MLKIASSRTANVLGAVAGLFFLNASAIAQVAPVSSNPGVGFTGASPSGSTGDLKPGWKVYVVRLIRHHPNMLPGAQGYRLGPPELSFIHQADKPDVYAKAYQAGLPGSAYGVVLKGILHVTESGRHDIVATLPKGPDVACQQTIVLNGETVVATRHGHQLLDQAMIEQVSAEITAGQVPIEIRLACAHERTGGPTNPALGSTILFRIQIKTPSADVLEPLKADQILHSANTRYE